MSYISINSTSSGISIFSANTTKSLLFSFGYKNVIQKKNKILKGLLLFIFKKYGKKK